MDEYRNGAGNSHCYFSRHLTRAGFLQGMNTNQKVICFMANKIGVLRLVSNWKSFVDESFPEANISVQN